MVVILNRDVKGTGKAGEVVKVSDGYARNMLIKRGWATEATDGNIRNLEKIKAKKAEEEAAEKAAAEALAAKIGDNEVIIKTKSGEGGRLFGSITSKDIAEALLKQHSIKVDKKKIQLDSPIKALGTFDVDIKLYYEVVGTLRVRITD
ncbi:50S ribosomal protein L9 [Aminicella lysinilytica]|jgi:large subunit ribosomal protein L9|uniref:Large ribosomal subunit protein bL9 n=1 Tax=Aminicella lysinilytica TaxID=433323 RepID=A0A4R6QAM6_9FIRM|nr:50S ribosomal protein L9 [Aminicella lysinilytica]NLD10769.1 50S ribosomal protein L9 [Clostridiales bacterium]TDP58976.1 LSU ribosomal protein L9P [Aminicella lysinilytica]